MSTRPCFAVGLTVLLAASTAFAGGLAMPGFGGMKPPAVHPTVEALRGVTAVIHTTAGDITIAFEADSAPNTVRNFVKLAQNGFYDGQRFYCVFKDRMVLAGDPTGTGKGDNGETLPLESTSLPHSVGTLAMDRVMPDPESGKKLSSGSRFLINLTDQSHLEKDYTVFAEITDGLDVAKRIGAARVKANDGRPAPLEDLVIESIVIRKKTEEDAKETE